MIRKMTNRNMIRCLHGRRLIALLLGVCLAMTIVFMLKNYDITLSSRHIIEFKANIIHSDYRYGVNTLSNGSISRDYNHTAKHRNGVTEDNAHGTQTAAILKSMANKSTSHISQMNPLKREVIKHSKPKDNNRNLGVHPQSLQDQDNLDNAQSSTNVKISVDSVAESSKDSVVQSLQLTGLVDAPNSQQTTTEFNFPLKTHMSPSRSKYGTTHYENIRVNQVIKKNNVKDFVEFHPERQIPNINRGTSLIHRNIVQNQDEVQNQDPTHTRSVTQDIVLDSNNMITRENYQTNEIPSPYKDDHFMKPTYRIATNEANSAAHAGRTHNIKSHSQFIQGNVQTNHIKSINSGTKFVTPPVLTNTIENSNLHFQNVEQPVRFDLFENNFPPSFLGHRNISSRPRRTYDCSAPRKVREVENILCMDKPEFLPNYKNPCWRDSRSGRLRCLPYFHLFGTCKSGTTDLFHRMTHHPQIIPNRGILSKETWFWSWRRYDPTIGQMLSRNSSNATRMGMTLPNFTDFFDAETIERHVTYVKGIYPYHKLVTGHGDPMDIWDFSRWESISQNDPMALEPNITTPYLIHHVNPDVKLIALLREPAERAYSHYLHMHSGDTKEEFHSDVIRTIKYLRNCEKSGELRACLYKQNVYIKAPLHASLYYLHLAEWLKVFPRNQILLITNDEYHRDRVGTLRKVFRHLNLDPITYSDFMHIAGQQKKYVSPLKARLGSMLPQTKAILNKYFENSIHKLVTLLNDTRYLKWIDSNSIVNDNINLDSLDEFNATAHSSLMTQQRARLRALGANFDKRKRFKQFNTFNFNLPTNNVPRVDIPSFLLLQSQKPNIREYNNNTIPHKLVTTSDIINHTLHKLNISDRKPKRTSSHVTAKVKSSTTTPKRTSSNTIQIMKSPQPLPKIVHFKNNPKN